MSNKKTWETMEQFQAEIDAWRVRAESAEIWLLRYAEIAKKVEPALSTAAARCEAAEARAATLEEALRAFLDDLRLSPSPGYVHATEGQIRSLKQALAGRKEG